MSFKKFISGVSAFAIAASAFAGMVVTANAETSTLMEYGTADVEWTTDGLATWTAGGSPALADGVVTISGGNGGYETSKTIAPTANSIIDVEAVWRAASATGRNFAAGNGSYFRFGNIIVAQNDQDKKHGYGFTGLANIASVKTFEAAPYRDDVTNCTWLKINMTIDTSQDKLTSFTIKSEDGTTTYADVSNVALADPNYTTVAFGYKKGGSVSTTNKEQLKSIKITETPQEVQTANYTIKHVGPDNVQVKEDQTKSSAVGAQITLSDADKADIAGQYYYVSDDSAEKTVAADGSTVVTVTYRAAEPYTATVTAKNGEDTLKVFSVDAVDSSATNRVYYTKYVEADGKYYVTDANGSYPSYAKDFTVAGNEDVAYTEAEDVLFASEIEALTPSRSWAANGSVPERYSNGGARRLYSKANVPVWTAAQRSKVTVSLWSRNQSSSQAASIGVYLKDSEGTLADTAVATIGEWASGANAEMTSEEFVVPTGYTVVLVNETEYNSNLEMDYVAVKGEVLPAAQYTVNYVVDETVVKSETVSGAVDEAPTVNMADFKVEDAKYICVSNDAEGKTVLADGTLVVTVTVRAATAYTVTVNGSDGTNIDTISVFEGDSTKYSYPKYTTDDNNAVKSVADETTFTKEVAPTEDTTITVPYTAYEGTAYFVDHEKITDTATLGSGNYSNGFASRAVSEGVEAFKIASAGTYDITVAASCRNTNNSSVFAVYKNSVADENLIFTDDVKGTSQNTVQTTGIKTVTDVELAEGDIIIIQGDNGQTWIDYVLAVQTAAAAPQVQTVKILIGDVSGDGKINVLDLTQLGRKVKGQTTNIGKVGQEKTKVDDTKILIGDVSGDSKINVLDLTQLGRKVKGQTTNIGKVGQEVEVIDESSAK